MMDIITSAKFKAAVSICAAIVMYFTPDNIDNIIMAMLTAYGATILVLEQKEMK